MDDGWIHRPSSFFQLALAFVVCLSLAACTPARQPVTLALLGDINLGRGVDSSAESFSILAKYMNGADLALANLESPLAEVLPAASSGYNLCAPAGRVALLSAWKLSLVSIANNHSLDCSSAGDVDTRSALEQAGITPLGPGLEPVSRQVNGLKLAFFAFDDVSSPLDTDAAVKAVQSAHANGSMVIVSIHWGLEYQQGASERQEQLAGRFAQAGADLIWGHHPHVLQPAAWIESGSRKTLVLYSLGNALFDQPGLANTRQSALALVKLDSGGVQSLQVVPFVIDVLHSRLAAPDPEAARQIMEALKIK